MSQVLREIDQISQLFWAFIVSSERAFISSRYKSYSCPISDNNLSFTSDLYYSSTPQPSYKSLWCFFGTLWSIPIFDRSSLELLLDMLEWKFCCYLSLAEYDPVAFVLFFRFLLIRIVILNVFLIQPRPLHEMKISQSDVWVQTLHKWLLFTSCHPSMFYSVLQLCPSYRQVKCKLHSAQCFNTFALRDTFSLPSPCILDIKTNTLRWKSTKWKRNGFMTAKTISKRISGKTVPKITCCELKQENCRYKPQNFEQDASQRTDG